MADKEKKEVKATDNSKDFISIEKSEELQKKGHTVVEIKTIEGVKMHKLEKAG